MPSAIGYPILKFLKYFCISAIRKLSFSWCLCNTSLLSVEVPAVVVGVVGMGHVPGIEKNWEKQLNISEIMRYGWLVLTQVIYCSVTVSWPLNSFSVPLSVFVFLSVAPPSRLSWVFRTVMKGVMMGMLGYTCYRAGGSLGRALLSLPTVQSLLATLRPRPAWPPWSTCPV